MWMMMGYNDAGDLDAIHDPFTGRNLRPLVLTPTPPLSSAPMPASTTPPASFPAPIHGTDLFALNHHLAMASEQNKRELISNTQQQVVVSSRWNPTPEQLQTLEELYRSGTRTPSAEQIQHITAQLRKYGKIEGKNVFYWFQNHKARERQKRRRQQLESLSDEHTNCHTQNGDKKELPPVAGAGPNKTGFEVEQTKNWASPTNSSTAAEKTVNKQGEAGDAECKAMGAGDGDGDGWAELDISDLQQRRNATWRMMHLSCSSSSSSSSSPTPTNHHLIMASSSALTVTSPTSIFVPHHPLHSFNMLSIPPSPYIPHHHFAEDHHYSSQTLQLFPLESSGGLAKQCTAAADGEVENEEDAQIAMDSGGHDDVAPYPFFEFLPLKN